MNYEERIQNLVDTGRITAEQGRAMAASLGGGVSAPPARRKLPIGMMALGAVLLAGGFLLFGGGAPEPDIIQNVNDTLNKSNEVGNMSKGLTNSVSIFVILLPIVLSVLWFMFSHNGLVSKEEEVLGAWAQVESNYQRRADLVPNLVNTVRTFMAHERAVLSGVAESRGGAGADDVAATIEKLQKAQAAAQELTQEAGRKLESEQHMQELSAAQKRVGESMRQLFGLVENYPQLRSADNFLALQDQLEGAENRINVARMAFNDAVREYNAAIRQMPASLVAGIGGFHRKAYFEAEKTSETPVGVAFE